MAGVGGGVVGGGVVGAGVAGLVVAVAVGPGAWVAVAPGVVLGAKLGGGIRFSMLTVGPLIGARSPSR